jgi:hypothetical protein
VEAGGEMNQALYAHMNNKTIKTKKQKNKEVWGSWRVGWGLHGLVKDKNFRLN